MPIGNQSAFARRLEYQMPILIGIAEALFGGGLVIAPELIRLPALLANFLPHLGIGLIAAGILTATIEPIARKRLQHDIVEIRSAHFETMLKGLMPERIFEEVQTQIIRQPFLRSNFSVTAELSWKENGEYLSHSQAITYDVTNIARTIEQFEVSAFEEKMYDDKFPDSTKIESINITLPGKADPLDYRGEELDARCESTDQVVKVRIPIPLLPGQTATVTVRIDGILASRDVYTHVMMNPTTEFDLIVTHPTNLLVRGMPLHPSDTAFKPIIKTSSTKRWRIRAGLLPFQGIEVSWAPKQLADETPLQ